MRPIVQCAKFIFRHLVTGGGARGIHSVGQQLMNSIHTVIHKLYMLIVTYALTHFMRACELRSSGGTGRLHGVLAQAH